MEKTPNLALYALASIAMGVVCAMVGYVAPGTETARQEMFQIAMALVTGGGGFMAGHALTKNAATPTVTINSATEPGKESNA